MTYKLFIDADVFLDILLIREPHFQSSLSIFHLSGEQKVELFTSSSIILNTNYIAQRQKDKKTATTGVAEILKFVEIIDCSKKILEKCFNTKYTDVEDAVQYFTALQNNSLHYYITRNTKHYPFKEIKLPVITPIDFLKSNKF